MSERVTADLLKLTYRGLCSVQVAESFRERIMQGALTRAENPASHISTFVMACDSERGKIYIGHHKKSGLWICNGGHSEPGELPVETAKRESFEEWGELGLNFEGMKPELLTITRIDNDRQVCKVHFDFWFFVRTDSRTFRPDPSKLHKEFYKAGWKSFEDARLLVTDPATVLAIDKLEGMF